MQTSIDELTEYMKSIRRNTTSVYNVVFIHFKTKAVANNKSKCYYFVQFFNFLLLAQLIKLSPVEYYNIIVIISDLLRTCVNNKIL